MEDDMNYQEDIEIDKYNLLEEWQHQAGLFMSYASVSTETQEVTDNAKDALDVKEATIELEIRNGTYPLLPAGMKVTDKAIAALVTTDPEVIVLKKQYNQLKKEATLMKKVETAFDHRKKALENMVTLTGREQYAEPRDVSEKSTSYLENQEQEKILQNFNKGKTK